VSKRINGRIIIGATIACKQIYKSRGQRKIKKNNLTSNRKKVKLLLKFGHSNWAILLVHFWEWTKQQTALGVFSYPGLSNKKLIEKR
jgi:hypothetical protein